MTKNPRHPGQPRIFRTGWVPGLLLVAAAALAYQPALRGQFVWDDDSWTTNLSGRLGHWPGLLSLWCSPTVLQQYYPLTGTTFWLDYQLWGFWTVPYHVENLLLHAGAAVLFWRLARRLGSPGAWLAGAIFALHPVMVESTAWITERKNVLSLVLFLGALLAYGRAVRFWRCDGDGVAPEPPAAPLRGPYLAALGLFLAAMLAKATAFAFPAVVLLIGWWKRGTIRRRADLAPLLPFFGLTLALGVMTSWLEQHHVGAQGSEWSISLPARCLIAGRAFWFYLGKLLWPANLCFVYPRWPLDPGSFGQWLYLAAAAALLLVLWLVRARIGRGPLAALLFFGVTLFPVLGFMNAYFMRYSFVCDHWVYLPSLGPIMLVAALVARAGQRLAAPWLTGGFALVVLPVLGLLTWQQSGRFADNETLWRATLAKNPDSWMAYDILGDELLGKGRYEQAIGCFDDALQIRPQDEFAYTELGNTFRCQGRITDALRQYQRALEIVPDCVPAHFNLANTLMELGHPAEAIPHYEAALRIQPELALAHHNLANALQQTGHTPEAIAQYNQALAIQPRARTHCQLAKVLLREGNAEAAVDHWRSAVALEPESVEARKNLAWVLATCPKASVRNGAEALTLARQANEQSGDKDPEILGDLAAAYAENGRFPEAVLAARRALELSSNRPDSSLADSLRSQLAQYEAGRPFRSVPGNQETMRELKLP